MYHSISLTSTTSAAIGGLMWHTVCVHTHIVCATQVTRGQRGGAILRIYGEIFNWVSSQNAYRISINGTCLSSPCAPAATGLVSFYQVKHLFLCWLFIHYMILIAIQPSPRSELSAQRTNGVQSPIFFSTLKYYLGELLAFSKLLLCWSRLIVKLEAEIKARWQSAICQSSFNCVFLKKGTFPKINQWSTQ